MSRKQLLVLFVLSTLIWTFNGVLPLLPVYAALLGAKPAAIGNYLSLSYLALVIGTVFAGWLSDKLQRRKVWLVIGSTIGIPGVWLMGHASNIQQLTALTAGVWFIGGIGVTLISILTGLFAHKTERGKVFGILAATGALGSLIGGLATGPIADRWGYETLFAVLAIYWSFFPVAALLLEDREIARPRVGTASTAQESSGLGRAFAFLLLATTVAGTVSFVGSMGTSLAMKAQGFALTAISSTGAVAGAVTLPLPILIGWLSDRVERRRLLGLCYLAGTAGMVILVAATSLWQFWVSAALRSLLVSGGRAAGSALATDLVPRESLGRGMSLFTTTTWVGGIIGFAGTGYAVQHLGIVSTFLLGALMQFVAIFLLIPVRRRQVGTVEL